MEQLELPEGKKEEEEEKLYLVDTGGPQFTINFPTPSPEVHVTGGPLVANDGIILTDAEGRRYRLEIVDGHLRSRPIDGAA